MLDDDHERDMMRRQMRAMLLIGLVLMGWMYFFAPAPPVQQPVESENTTQQTENPNTPLSPNNAQLGSTPAASNPDAPVQWPNLPAEMCPSPNLLACSLKTVSRSWLCIRRGRRSTCGEPTRPA